MANGSDNLLAHGRVDVERCWRVVLGAYRRRDCSALESGPTLVPARRLLVGKANAKHGRIFERSSGDLHAQRQTVVAESTRQRQGRGTRNTEQRAHAGRGPLLRGADVAMRVQMW